MKIQCDACHKYEASFFCVADEAALCPACDHRVHHANELASKHQRFSLLRPSPKQGPLCDICQERKALLFCQQDRAILCRECDVPIHKANEHTQKHNRFLLTGVKLSATSAVYSSSSSTVAPANSPANFKSQTSKIKPVLPPPVVVSPTIQNNPLSQATNKPPTSNTAQQVTAAIVNDKGAGNGQSANAGGNGLTTSSILEYLEMLPGYHVEELLDSSYGLCEICDNDVLSVWGTDIETSPSSLSSENSVSNWTPQVLRLQANQNQNFPATIIAFGEQVGFKDSKEVKNTNASRKWRVDNSFAVPQISPSSTVSKRSRTLW